VLAERAPLPDVLTGPAVFFGDDACLTVALLAGLRGVQAGRPLLIVDGANAFDPFLVAGLARKSGLVPQALLDQIRISRVFTCYQLEALLRGRLRAAVQRFSAAAVFFSGILDPLLDAEVPVAEARRIFALLPPALRALATARVGALCACLEPRSAPGRERLFPALCATAAWVFEVTRAQDPPGGLQVTCRKPRAMTWTWEPQIGLIAPRRWW